LILGLRGAAQVVEHLSSKHKALSSKPHTAKKKKNKVDSVGQEMNLLLLIAIHISLPVLIFNIRNRNTYNAKNQKHIESAVACVCVCVCVYACDVSLCWGQKLKPGAEPHLRTSTVSLRRERSLAPVAHAYNPNYQGGSDQEAGG
jgi:hypothetical protein